MGKRLSMTGGLRALTLGAALCSPLGFAQQPAKTEFAPPAQGGARTLRGMGQTPEERALLEELAGAIERYEEESKSFRREVQLLVEKKYEDKRNTLADSYEQALRDLEVLERKERLDAIANFEEFLERYPDDPKYSPDVMFRLAELYYERSTDDHIVAMRDYEERLRKLEPDKGSPPPEPQVDFAHSISLHRRLLSRFPDYRLNDGAYYLLGYCLEKQGQFEEGRAAYQELIARYPKSKFTTEAWVRIGEYHFDAFGDPEALPKAAEAYEHAVTDLSHGLYDKALYKLGWTYYRMDRFDDAVARFLKLVDFYETRRNAKGGEAAGGELRNEALQYTAISLADEKWGSLAKGQEIFAQLGGRPYEAEVYRRLADVYFDQTKHTEAIEGYRLVLIKDPTIVDAPQIQQKIVQALERDRKLPEAFAEGTRLANMFGPGTPWYEKHKKDPDLIAAAVALAEKSLYSGAVYHHQQALQYKREQRFEEAKASFEEAARAYGNYLARFSHSKHAYEMEFYLAECLYSSLQFPEAGKHYALVRDSSQDVKFLADAAFSAVLSWQKQLELDVRAKLAPELKIVLSRDRQEGAPIRAFPLTRSEAALVSASDAFVSKLPADPRAPGIAYKVAELYYSHDDFPEARRRFEAIIAAYPKNEVAKFSMNLTVESLVSERDWAQVEQVAGRLAEKTDVIDSKSDLYRELVKFKLAGRFKLGDQLFGKGEYDLAAAKYIALVDEEPKHEFADKALNNAAVAYENTRRFESALKLYERIFREYPNSKLADAALFRVAVNAENSYDFDKAVDSYQRLVKDYPASKDREAALFNAARLLEGLQRYDEAAAAFLRYVDLFPKAEDSPKNQFRAALIYEKQQSWEKQIRALGEFVAKFSSNPAQLELTIDARKRIGDAYLKLGKQAEAAKAYRAAADEFDRRNLKPNEQLSAAAAAAEARFQLAEFELKAFDRLKIGGSRKALEKSFAAKRAAVKKVSDVYGEVFRYKNLQWTLAALYRRGYALERFGQTILETPVPPEVKKLGEEAVVLYQDALSQQTVVLEDKAVESYAATLAEARKNRISNEWTKRTLEALNRFRPKEYPVLKEPKHALVERPIYPEGLASVNVEKGPQRLQGEDK